MGALGLLPSPDESHGHQHLGPLVLSAQPGEAGPGVAGGVGAPWDLWVHVRRGRLWEPRPGHDFPSLDRDPSGAAPQTSPSRAATFKIFGHATWHAGPRPGIEPLPPAVEAQSPDHWIGREDPRQQRLLHCQGGELCHRPVLEHRLLLVRKHLTFLEQNASVPEVSLAGLWKFCSGESGQCRENIFLQCSCSARASC